MKKIWYIDDDHKGIKRIVKLLVYEKNQELVAQLDLKGFADLSIESLRDICFFHRKEGIIETVECGKYKDFSRKALAGHGILPIHDLSRFGGMQEDLEISILIDGVRYSSDKKVDFTKYLKLKDKENEEEKERLDTTYPLVDLKQDDFKNNGRDQRESKQLERYIEVEDEDFDNEIQQGYRKVIALSMLEDEMLFRTYLHNSFLLHGYYNYGHLILDESNNSCRLGVPGNYYEREQMVATMFGFPDFEPAKDEKIQSGTFGYFFTKG